MKLTKLIIDGFRSYGEPTTISFDNITTLIGSNGAGKTTAKCTK
ncbi:AAA family ATPase [Secundilactobacillus kimchicus]|nr:AAA family ATPase [Secundilactobacillus kimchicus]